MTTEQLLKLVDAGFTRDEILKMEAPADPEKKPADPEPDPKPADPEPEPEKKPDDPEPASGNLAAFQKALDDFTKKLQAFEIKNAVQPKTNPETPEDILAKLMMPSYNKEKE